MNLIQYKKELANEGVFFSFNGPVSQELVIELGGLLRKKLQVEQVELPVILRVFSMIVELAQNIINYSGEKTKIDVNEHILELRNGILVVGMEGCHYFVHAGNLVENEDVQRLQSRLDNLRNMDKEALKKHYKKQRRQDPEKSSKGAGLGFIEIARKSSRQIEYEFKQIDERFSFFSLKTVV